MGTSTSDTYIELPKKLYDRSGQCIPIPQLRAFVTDVESGRGYAVYTLLCISSNIYLTYVSLQKICMDGHCRRISVCDRGLQVLHSNVSTGNTFPLLTYLPAPSGSESL